MQKINSQFYASVNILMVRVPKDLVMSECSDYSVRMHKRLIKYIRDPADTGVHRRCAPAA